MSFVVNSPAVVLSQDQAWENLVKNLLFFSGGTATLRTFVISIIFLEVYLERAFW